MLQVRNEVVKGCCSKCMKNDVCKYVPFYQELMRTIYKYPLVDANQNVITGHFEAFLKLDYQGKIPTVWAITDDERVEASYIITVKSTGWDLDDKERIIGTLEDECGFIWHCFCRRANKILKTLPSPAYLS